MASSKLEKISLPSLLAAAGLTVVLLVAAGGVYFGILEAPSGTSAPVHDLERAPNFLWPDLNDPQKAIYMEELRGKVLLLNFWAGWCVFCIEEMPIFEELSHDYRDRGFLVIGIHRSDTEAAETGLGFAREKGVTYQLVGDGRSGNSFRYFSRGSQLMPTSVIIDREGYVREVIFGSRNESQWRALLEPLL